MLHSKNESLKNDIYQPYLTINTNIALNKPAKINGSYKKLTYPKIGIYNGAGASHSWLWFVDILDSMGFFDIEFVDEQHIKNGGLKNLQVLLLSGGDTFAIAESLGKEGAEKIRVFLEEGGLYIGSCAGAYLPLKSSLTPLNLFNFTAVKINNLTKSLPDPVTLPEKFCTSYGCQYVFHPVREEVKISLTDSTIYQQNGELVAPIYGGPSFLPSENAKTLAIYTGFTKQTLFMTDQQLAYDTLIGKSAVITNKLGDGHLFLLGPHLEHPHYFKANTLIADMIYYGIREREVTSSFSIPSIETSECKNLNTLWRDIKSQVSNSRIVTFSLERNPITWLIGKKVYEPLKIRAFLEMVWARFPHLEQLSGRADINELINLRNSFKEITRMLKEIKRAVDQGIDTTDKASTLFATIKNSCALFFAIYFNNKLSSARENNRFYN
ncbi:MAG: hypothetical protein JRE20_02100 [Deltaproteobacteria bacterium]|nr:hypothetical protein [Deltaproteobacteria bacterium]